eukprot:CAMPEP_0172488902 /NCGR_PEP_ID=MMETSP1066-20121228/18616_1 /TAXON_ID=671091 /ORGANISM="Coscinodiscus wailesii, Strain CCMP2513" /LENGTH=388 /DNA_ID=CAMNT_0013256403 /DNA_START=143 /DNA_END=1309 /DNA_ORIENTATION=+
MVESIESDVEHGSQPCSEGKDRLLESKALLPLEVSIDDDNNDPKNESKVTTAPSAPGTVTKIGFAVLILLAVQNCAKNIIMRYVMKDSPAFLKSAAVLSSEFTKMSLSVGYILLIQRRPLCSIVTYFREDATNTLLLIIPASAYNLQTSMEYVALAHLDSASFSVLVQSKLVFTAVFAAIVLRKRLKYVQIISLLLLTTGVMLCNLPRGDGAGDAGGGTDGGSGASYGSAAKGIMATLTIAVSSGFASVYTEKVIKGRRRPILESGDYGLAYMQVQLAAMSILTMGGYAIVNDYSIIVEHGLFYNFSTGAAVTVSQSAIGGLIVAGVLKYADSILKGYATALSVVMTGVLSMIMFETKLDIIYFIGVSNVMLAVVLYNGQDLDKYACS